MTAKMKNAEMILQPSVSDAERISLLLTINVKKLQFMHTVNGDGSKTAKIRKRQC